MTKRLKVGLVMFFAAVAAACTVAGCKIGEPDKNQILAGYGPHVIYYSNGGKYDGSTTLTVRDFYFKVADRELDGVPFYDIGTNSGNVKVERSNYELLGWYLPERYPEGDAHAGEIMYTYTFAPDEDRPAELITQPVYPVLDEKGNSVTDSKNDRPVFAREGVDEQIQEDDVRLVVSDTRITSDYIVKSDTRDNPLIVCAKWGRAMEIVYKLVVTDADGNLSTKEFEGEDGKIYSNDAESEEAYTEKNTLDTLEFGKGETQTPSGTERVKLAGTTFVRNYLDAELTIPVAPITRPEDDKNPVVYCHYVEGDWTVITNDSTAVSKMFTSLYRGGNYYIIDDITYATNAQAINLNYATDFTDAVIKCNKPHKISNLRFAGNSLENLDSVSVFGSWGANFTVSDLTLENVSITASSGGNITLYAVCSSSQANPENIDLKIEGLTATVNLPADRRLLNNKDTKWLCGGSLATDRAFLENYTGLVINNAEITVNQ